MRPSEALEKNRELIRRIVSRHHAANPRVFGSALHGGDTEVSDIDLLVDANEKATLFDIVTLERELRETLGVKVDVQTPESLSKRFRAEVLREARPL